MGFLCNCVNSDAASFRGFPNTTTFPLNMVTRISIRCQVAAIVHAGHVPPRVVEYRRTCPTFVDCLTGVVGGGLAVPPGFQSSGSAIVITERRGSHENRRLLKNNLPAELLTNTIYLSILLNNGIYKTHGVLLSDGGSACIHSRRSPHLTPYVCLVVLGKRVIHQAGVTPLRSYSAGRTYSRIKRHVR